MTQTNTLGLFNPIQYPNAGGDPNLSNRTIAEWFDPRAFAIAPQDVLGNAPRASFFGPGQNNWNIAISRIFPIKERVNFRIRAEFYDAFNHPQWSNLNTSITSPAFGSVTPAMDPRTVQFAGQFVETAQDVNPAAEGGETADNFASQSDHVLGIPAFREEILSSHDSFLALRFRQRVFI